MRRSAREWLGTHGESSSAPRGTPLILRQSGVMVTWYRMPCVPRVLASMACCVWCHKCLQAAGLTLLASKRATLELIMNHLCCVQQDALPQRVQAAAPPVAGVQGGAAGRDHATAGAVCVSGTCRAVTPQAWHAPCRQAVRQQLYQALCGGHLCEASSPCISQLVAPPHPQPHNALPTIQTPSQSL